MSRAVHGSFPNVRARAAQEPSLRRRQIDASDASPLNCIICDISARGARLTVGTRNEVPDEFTLVLRRRCRVVRRSDGQVGVEFV
jgi:hypothetical protein